MDPYRDKYVPGHHMWQDIAVHGTNHKDVDGILDIGLVPGGIYVSELKRRSEIHLVTSVVRKGKTPGVRTGSSAYIYVDMKRMDKDGVEFFFSEATRVIFTRGVRWSFEIEGIHPKYITQVKTAFGHVYRPTNWPLPWVSSQYPYPPAKRKELYSLEEELEDAREPKAPAFSIFSADTAVVAPENDATPFKSPSMGRTPVILSATPLIPTVTKSPPAVPPPVLGHENELDTELRSSSGVPVMDPPTQKSPPAALRAARQDLSKKAITVLEVPKGVSTQGLPEIVNRAEGLVQSPWGSFITPRVRNPQGGASASSDPVPVKAAVAKVPPPPPMNAPMTDARLPAGYALPKAGTSATKRELEKIGVWCMVSSPQGRGIVKPQPKEAVLDFYRLFPSWLHSRGLNKDVMEQVGNYNGWLEFKLKQPVIPSIEARVVCDNWDNETAWPRTWKRAFHGT